MGPILAGKRVAILATDGFEQSELFEPKRALEDNGAIVSIISIHGGKILSWYKNNWGESAHVDCVVNEISSKDYDALVLPGGVMNADTLRTHRRAIAFVKSMADEDKPIGAICHAPWLLIEARLVDSRAITSWVSLKTDLTNAGANWVDDEVVADEQLVTSRGPDDLDAFNNKLIETIRNDWHRVGAKKFSEKQDKYTFH